MEIQGKNNCSFFLSLSSFSLRVWEPTGEWKRFMMIINISSSSRRSASFSLSFFSLKTLCLFSLAFSLYFFTRRKIRGRFFLRTRDHTVLAIYTRTLKIMIGLVFYGICFLYSLFTIYYATKIETETLLFLYEVSAMFQNANWVSSLKPRMLRDLNSE